MTQKYPDIDRGTPARITHRKHIPPFMFKVAGELYDHYGEICEAINNIGMVGNAKKKNEAIALIGGYAPEMAQLKVQLASTDKHISYIEKELHSQRDVTEQYRSKNYEQELKIEEANDKIYELNRKQKELEKVISVVPPDLLEQLRSNEMLAHQSDDSRATIQRYIRLTYLEKPLLDLVDEGKIAFTPAVELSFLLPEEQAELIETIESEDCTPSLSQAQRMRKMSGDGVLDMDVIFSVMTEVKGNQKEYLKLPTEKYDRYLGRFHTPQQKEDFIMKALDHYSKYLIRQRDRDR